MPVTWFERCVRFRWLPTEKLGRNHTNARAAARPRVAATRGTDVAGRRSCVAVTLTAAFTNLACWRGFAWLVERTHISAATWPVAFVALWIAPALAASVLLLALGTHLADHNR